MVYNKQHLVLGTKPLGDTLPLPQLNHIVHIKLVAGMGVMGAMEHHCILNNNINMIQIIRWITYNSIPLIVAPRQMLGFMGAVDRLVGCRHWSSLILIITIITITTTSITTPTTTTITTITITHNVFPGTITILVGMDRMLGLVPIKMVKKSSGIGQNGTKTGDYYNTTSSAPSNNTDYITDLVSLYGTGTGITGDDKGDPYGKSVDFNNRNSPNFNNNAFSHLHNTTNASLPPTPKKRSPTRFQTPFQAAGYQSNNVSGQYNSHSHRPQQHSNTNNANPSRHHHATYHPTQPQQSQLYTPQHHPNTTSLNFPSLPVVAVSPQQGMQTIINPQLTATSTLHQSTTDSTMRRRSNSISVSPGIPLIIQSHLNDDDDEDVAGSGQVATVDTDGTILLTTPNHSNAPTDTINPHTTAQTPLIMGQNGEISKSKIFTTANSASRHRYNPNNGVSTSPSHNPSTVSSSPLALNSIRTTGTQTTQQPLTSISSNQHMAQQAPSLRTDGTSAASYHVSSYDDQRSGSYSQGQGQNNSGPNNDHNDQNHGQNGQNSNHFTPYQTPTKPPAHNPFQTPYKQSQNPPTRPTPQSQTRGGMVPTKQMSASERLNTINRNMFKD